MAVVALPNAELVARDHLANDDAVLDLVAEDLVCSELPKGWAGTGEPALRVLRIGGHPHPGRAHWVDRPRIQCEAWAATKNAAHDLAATAQAASVDAPNHFHDLAVVTSVRVIVGLQDIPDPAMKRAMHRFIFDAVWTLHPHRPGVT